MISSFERLTLKIMTMRGSYEYEVTACGESARAVHYVYRYIDGKEVKTPEREALVSAEAVTALFNSCGLERFDGCRGKHPKGVKDGVMFTLEATVNDNKTIRAEGSESFPRGYQELVSGLEGILNNTQTGENSL